MTFHHIGVATKSIEKSIIAYEALGYELSSKFIDTVQGVNLAFLNKLGFPTIELVSPFSEFSPVSDIINKSGTTPYHTCFEVENIEVAIVNLRSRRYLLLKPPVPAIAFNNRMICFMFHNSSGLIELLQKEVK